MCGRREEAINLVRLIKGARLADMHALLRTGASPNLVMDDGRSPLHVAAEQGSVKIIQALLAHGADVNAGASTGFTPLFAAALTGHLSATAALLAAGANPLAGPDGKPVSAALPATAAAALRAALEAAESDWRGR